MRKAGTLQYKPWGFWLITKILVQRAWKQIIWVISETKKAELAEFKVDHMKPRLLAAQRNRDVEVGAVEGIIYQC